MNFWLLTAVTLLLYKTPTPFIVVHLLNKIFYLTHFTTVGPPFNGGAY